jgi:phytoene synthase
MALVNETTFGVQPAQPASNSSFYMAMRLLPRSQREAMFAIYAFFRTIDDIADEGDWPSGHRLAELENWRADLEELYRGRASPRVLNLADPVRRFDLRKEDFLAAVDGVEMDVRADFYPPDFAMLDLYCDRVASAVGRLSVRIFGMGQEAGLALAHHLGRALQLTNILRDLDEDAAIGRLYLPREILSAAGIPPGSPSTVIANRAIDRACRALAHRARRHYREADAIMDERPMAEVRAPRLMRGVYGRILDEMEAHGWAGPRSAVHVGKARLAWIALKYGLVG